MRYPNEGTVCFIDGTELVSVADPRLGTLIGGRYVLEEVIGEGGMAVVYRARATNQDRVVAIKILRNVLAQSEKVLERFKREARNARRLSHPNIIEVLEDGETSDGSWYLAMELLEGRSLGEIVAPGAMDLARAMPIMIQVARAIARAHDLDIVHRDLKPDNIFILRKSDGTDMVKLLDFGISRSKIDARLTSKGDVFGTPEYMAPEQISGRETGSFSDLYALGIVFYEMVVGKVPFSAKDPATLFAKHLETPPPDPSLFNSRIPRGLSVLILELLEKDPAKRPVDAHRVHQTLLDLASARELPVPIHAEREAQSIRTGQQSQLALHDDDPWPQRARVLTRLVDTAFGGRPPPDVAHWTIEVQQVTDQAARMRLASVAMQHTLEEVDGKSRETRQRLGFAVDALGADVSRARDEVRVSRTVIDVTRARCVELAQQFAEAHKEITFWEGRAGFQEPHADLAAAYRAAADVLDTWKAARAEEDAAVKKVEADERARVDLEFQLRELRNALALREDEAARARSQHEEQIAAQGRQIAELDERLVTATSRICTPLRGQPGLDGLFRELEGASLSASGMLR
jgi:tRNA A-37 threonylcarbamoyl transferase component Bud32